MADAFTSTSAVNYDQVAYDRIAYFAFRPQNYFDQVADVKPTRQTQPGSSTIFTIQNDLAVASTPLTETVDVDAVALSDTQVTVALAEYGNATNTTAKLRGTSFLEIDPLVANAVGYNAGVSIDTIARNILEAGTYVRYAGTATSRATVAAADTLKASNVRRAFAELQNDNVPQIGGLYTAYIHPLVAYDLRAETGAAAWRDPHTYSQPEEIWNGEIGEFEGFRFIVTPRAPQFPGTGAGTTPNRITVFRTLFMGREALAKTYSTTDGNGPNPRVVPGPIVDKLRRFVPMGWYWLGGYGLFRQASIRAVESSSSIAPTT